MTDNFRGGLKIFVGKENTPYRTGKGIIGINEKSYVTNISYIITQII